MSIARRLASLIGTSDPDVRLWETAVKVNGGWVSKARLDIVAAFVAAEKAAGNWALTDDYWGLWAENSVQSLVSLKQRRLASAINSPTFVADRHYLFDGLSSYITTGFIPSASCVAATLNNARIAVYERTNVSANTYAVGGLSSSSRSLSIRPRVAGVAYGSAQFQSGTWTLATADSRGYTAVSRAASAAEMYKNGAALVNSVFPVLSTGSLPDSTIYVAALNSAGTPSGFRAASIGFVAIGGPLSGAQELAQYNAVQAWATSIGANV